jgi:hypothetical protein
MPLERWLRLGNASRNEIGQKQKQPPRTAVPGDASMAAATPPTPKNIQ